MGDFKCNVCGSELSASDTFCPNCGCPVEIKAPVEPEPEDNTMSTNSGDSGGFSQETTVLTGNPFNNENQSNVYQNTTNVYANSAYQNNTNAYANNGYQNNAYVQPAGNYGQNGNTSVSAPNKKQSENGLGITAMIVGILSVLCCFGGSVFGVVGIILAIVCLAKKKGKPFSIIGLITSIIGFVLGIVVLIIVATSWGEITSQFGTNTGNGGYTSDGGGDVLTIDSSFDMDGQVIINGDAYFIPDSMEMLGLSVNDEYADIEDMVQDEGFAPGEYKFVLLDSVYGYSMWGYIENTGNSTVYSVDDLSVTGLNVDNYSGSCTATTMTAFGGVYIGASRYDVESLLGLCEEVDDDGLEVYSSGSGDYALRIGYDENGMVEELDLTCYN